ncbi:glycosyltransferase [Halomonas sp. HNIBRBA4712]|uniref:glycosyltransferase n=1 Tax=Halomonas sp. HNIBRBA4712 TaxID=3373087 RepID=UPI003746E2AF
MNAIVEKDMDRIRKSVFFDAEWYVNTYKDVLLTGIDPVTHYQKYGALLGRSPSTFLNINFFASLTTERGALYEYLNYKQNVLNKIKKAQLSSLENDFKDTATRAANQFVLNNKFSKAVTYLKRYGDIDQVGALPLIMANNYLKKDRIGHYLACFNAYINKVANVKDFVLDENFLKERFFFKNIKSLNHPKINNKEKITIIMAVYNSAETIRYSIRSILEQTYTNIQLIVIDDASNDGTIEIIKEEISLDPRVLLIKNEKNVGPYASKNYALKFVQGKYITCHDSDDWAYPTRLERQHKKMLEAKCVVSTVKMIRISKEGLFTKATQISENTKDGFYRTAFVSAMFEYEFFKRELGSWDVVRFGGDSEIIKRTKKIVGENGFYNLEFLGLLCLDNTEGLTARKTGKINNSRINYREAYSNYHDSGQPLVYEFPSLTRKFELKDNDIKVNEYDLKFNIDSNAKKNELNVDVCIITNLRFPGGNASSTIDEVNTCISNGLSVVVVHCSPENTKLKTISERYLKIKNNIIVNSLKINSITCKYLIIRHPLVVTSKAFKNIVKKVNYDSFGIVVNNSEKRGNGAEAYSYKEFKKNLQVLQKSKGCIYPLSKSIREELIVREEVYGVPIASYNWHPLFNVDDYEFKPKKNTTNIIKVGRHGRDHVDKWLSSKELIEKIYPSDEIFKISILGGADKAKDILHDIPSNWEVLPFGSVDPSVFLHDLDFFVYFPKPGLNEAFGRTIMEAIFTGTPCILPKRFKDNFGDLVYYAEPEEVKSLIKRLFRDQKGLHERCLDIYNKAKREFDSSNLIKRMNLKVSEKG